MSFECKFKRFLVFGGDHYYPVGGILDLKGAVMTWDQAKELAVKGHRPCSTWWMVVNLATGECLRSQDPAHFRLNEDGQDVAKKQT